MYLPEIKTVLHKLSRLLNEAKLWAQKSIQDNGDHAETNPSVFKFQSFCHLEHHVYTGEIKEALQTSDSKILLWIIPSETKSLEKRK